MCGFEARLRVLGCTKVCGVDVWPGILCYREFAERLRKVRSQENVPEGLTRVWKASLEIEMG